MQNTHHTKPLASKAIDDPEMHPENRPESYDNLSPAEQAALLGWIGLAIKPAKTAASSTSYGIKHDFEKVGFYITNGQFRGSMLATCYAPVDSTEPNWLVSPLLERFVEANTNNKNVPEERNELITWNGHPQALWALRSAGLNLKSTNKQTLAEHAGNSLADALRAFRKVGDVARRFRETKAQNGRVHAKWKQVEADTGRMACENPPLQGIPKPLKRAFVAPAGHKLIVSDLSQIEVRVLAALSGDENLRQEFIAGEDIHRAVAANVLGIARQDVTPEQRKLAKSLVFGLLYGQGLKGFAQKAREVFKKNYTEAEVEEKFWKPFFEAYPGVARWRKNTIARFDRGRRESYTKLGRRRLNLENSRQALNTPIEAGPPT